MDDFGSEKNNKKKKSYLIRKKKIWGLGLTKQFTGCLPVIFAFYLVGMKLSKKGEDATS